MATILPYYTKAVPRFSSEVICNAHNFSKVQKLLREFETSYACYMANTLRMLLETKISLSSLLANSDNLNRFLLDKSDKKKKQNKLTLVSLSSEQRLNGLIIHLTNCEYKCPLTK